MSGDNISVRLADYANPADATALVHLLDAYAQDPAGGGEGLQESVKSHLVAELAKRPQAFSVLAFDGGGAVGLVNCIEGFSTFKCKPLVNIHDVSVLASHRGRRIAERMFAVVALEAQRRGAVKLTLEVLSGNVAAQKAYRRMGFEGYQLDPGMDTAEFMQKWLPEAGVAGT